MSFAYCCCVRIKRNLWDKGICTYVFVQKSTLLFHQSQSNDLMSVTQRKPHQFTPNRHTFVKAMMSVCWCFPHLIAVSLMLDIFPPHLQRLLVDTKTRERREDLEIISERGKKIPLTRQNSISLPFLPSFLPYLPSSSFSFENQEYLIKNSTLFAISNSSTLRTYSIH